MKRWLFSLSIVALVAAQVQSDEPAAPPACGKCCPQQAAPKCCQDGAAKCCATKGDAPCCQSRGTAVSEDDELYGELVALVRETNSRDTFMAAVAGLMATDKAGRRAIPVVIRHAERLGVLKGMAS